MKVVNYGRNKFFNIGPDMFFYVAKIIMFNKKSTNTKDLKKLTQI